MSCLLLSCLLFSCQVSLPDAEIKRIKNSKTTLGKILITPTSSAPVITTTSKSHVHVFSGKSIVGDFDGDSISDRLYEILRSRKTGCLIDSIYYVESPESNMSHYDILVDSLISLQPVLKLKSQGNLHEIELHQGQIFGILLMQNMGNINDQPGDEIAIIQNYADWSNCNSCSIYSFCSGSWHKVFSFEIREYELYEARTQEPKLNHVLTLKHDQWYYKKENYVEGYYHWQKLEHCACPAR